MTAGGSIRDCGKTRLLSRLGVHCADGTFFLERDEQGKLEMPVNASTVAHSLSRFLGEVLLQRLERDILKACLLNWIQGGFWKRR